MPNTIIDMFRSLLFCLLLLISIPMVAAEQPFAIHPKANEVTQRQQLEKMIKPLCSVAQVAKLEQAAQALRKRNFSDGTNQLDTLLDVVANSPAVVQAWRKKFPKSDLALCCSINYHIDKAWEHRGRGWAREVSEDGWKGFKRELNLAEQDCRTAEKLPTQSPNLYVSWLTVGRGLQYSSAVNEKLFQKAITLNPTYLGAYDIHMVGLLDRWGGTRKERLQLLAQATQNLDPKFGKNSGYAVVCMTVAQYTGDNDIDDELGSYDKVRFREGATALTKRFPRSARYPSWLLRSYFVGGKQDFQVGRSMYPSYLDRIDPKVIPPAFIDEYLK